MRLPYSYNDFLYTGDYNKTEKEIFIECLSDSLKKVGYITKDLIPENVSISNIRDSNDNFTNTLVDITINNTFQSEVSFTLEYRRQEYVPNQFLDLIQSYSGIKNNPDIFNNFIKNSFLMGSDTILSINYRYDGYNVKIKEDSLLVKNSFRISDSLSLISIDYGSWYNDYKGYSKYLGEGDFNFKISIFPDRFDTTYLSSHLAQLGLYFPLKYSIDGYIPIGFSQVAAKIDGSNPGGIDNVVIPVNNHKLIYVPVEDLADLFNGFYRALIENIEYKDFTLNIPLLDSLGIKIKDENGELTIDTGEHFTVDFSELVPIPYKEERISTHLEKLEGNWYRSRAVFTLNGERHTVYSEKWTPGPNITDDIIETREQYGAYIIDIPIYVKGYNGWEWVYRNAFLETITPLQEKMIGDNTLKWTNFRYRRLLEMNNTIYVGNKYVYEVSFNFFYPSGTDTSVYDINNPSLTLNNQKRYFLFDHEPTEEEFMAIQINDDTNSAHITPFIIPTATHIDQFFYNKSSHPDISGIERLIVKLTTTEGFNISLDPSKHYYIMVDVPFTKSYKEKYCLLQAHDLLFNYGTNTWHVFDEEKDVNFLRSYFEGNVYPNTIDFYRSSFSEMIAEMIDHWQIKAPTPIESIEGPLYT